MVVPIRLPAFPSRCLYRIFCFVRAVIHALCCYSFLPFMRRTHSSFMFCTHLSFMRRTHSSFMFCTHIPRSCVVLTFIVHALYLHPSFMRRCVALIHCSCFAHTHRSCVAASHSFILHVSHSLIIHASHSFSVQVSAMHVAAWSLLDLFFSLTCIKFQAI